MLQCEECNGEIIKMQITKQYLQCDHYWGAQLVTQIWYQCDNCTAEYNQTEIKNMIKELKSND